jgi:hypothetical protein
MTIFDQLYELNDTLLADEMWVNALETTCSEFGVKDLDELISKAIEEEDETMVYDLLNEGQYILSLKADDINDWYDDEYDDDY